MDKATIAMVAAVLAGSWTALAQAPEAKKTWADSLTFKGGIRYRYEAINDDSKKDSEGDTFTRDRQRIRAMLGAEAKLPKDMTAGVELSTGQSDPVSGNQTLGDGFTKKDFGLNRAYFDWKALADEARTVKLVAGKMKNPLINVADLVWDGDCTPEGLAVQGSFGGEPVKLLANGSYFWLQERSSDDDSMMYAGQLAVQLDPAPEFSVIVGGTYYQYTEIKGRGVLDWEDKNNAYGNSTTLDEEENKFYKYDYIPVELFVKVDAFLGALPVSVYGQYVVNGEAKDEDTGYLAGLSLGKAKNPGTWEGGYRFARLEKDAVLGAFTDSDRWGGGTDGEGHKVYGKYQIAKNVQAGLTYFLDEKKISDSSKTTDYDRLQADIVVSF